MSEINLIQLKTEDLKAIFGQIVKAEFESVKENINKEQVTRYLSRKDVSKMLNIHITSVVNWSKKGILTPYQIGNRVYYRLVDIENAIIKLKR